MPGPRKDWPEEDETFLRDNADTLTVRQISVRLGRRYEAVRSYADVRGIKLTAHKKPEVQAAYNRGGQVGAWSDERFDTAKRLWLDGVPASQIAKALKCGLSRAAIIGKIHRAGLAGASRPRPVASAPRPLAQPKAPSPKRPTAALVQARERSKAPVAVCGREAPKTPAAPVQFERPRDPNDPVIPLLKLDHTHCRWPLGEPGRDSFGFCGKRRPDGATYCAEHARIAYQPRAETKRKAGPVVYERLRAAKTWAA